MTGWREASKPNAFSRLRPSIIDPTGLTNLGEVIVDLIDVVAFDGNRLIVRGNIHYPVTAHRQRFQLQKQLPH
jgi:hypothetical protein